MTWVQDNWRLTPEQEAQKLSEYEVAKAEETELRDQAKALEREASKVASAVSRNRFEINRSKLIEDPPICDPHGKECIQEPPCAMSAGAMLHIEDGATCYAASIGRRSEFTEEYLEQFREMRKKRPGS